MAITTFHRPEQMNNFGIFSINNALNAAFDRIRARRTRKILTFFRLKNVENIQYCEKCNEKSTKLFKKFNKIQTANEIASSTLLLSNLLYFQLFFYFSSYSSNHINCHYTQRLDTRINCL